MMSSLCHLVFGTCLFIPLLNLNVFLLLNVFVWVFFLTPTLLKCTVVRVTHSPSVSVT